MEDLRTLPLRRLGLVVRTIVLTATCLAVGASEAPPPQNNAPVVEAAQAPLYPPLARLAGIEGTVRLSVTTDGLHPSTILAESGPPMLVEAAINNINTWKFKTHKPARFETTFRYILNSPALCDLDSGVVILRLPTEAEISASRVKTCDPTEVVPQAPE